MGRQGYRLRHYRTLYRAPGLWVYATRAIAFNGRIIEIPSSRPLVTTKPHKGVVLRLAWVVVRYSPLGYDGVGRLTWKS